MFDNNSDWFDIILSANYVIVCFEILLSNLKHCPSKLDLL